MLQRFLLILFCSFLLIPGISNAGEIRLVDRNEREVVLQKEAKRVVSLMQECTTVMLTLGAGDQLVGVDKHSASDKLNGLVRFKENPVVSVGETKQPNLELIVSLKPDLILTWGGYGTDLANEIQKHTGVPVMCLHTLTTIDGVKANYSLVGRAIGKQQRMQALLDYGDASIESITKLTHAIPEEKRPRVHLLFWGFWNGVSRIPIYYDPVTIAGGVNIASGQTSNVYGYSVKVPVEQVVVWNPDFIFIHGSPSWAKVTPNKVMSDPRMQNVTAVKNRNVDYTLGMWRGWHYPRALTETIYMAKKMHPELFKSLDPRSKGDEIYEFFYGKPGLWSARGKELGLLQ